jgi:hypothetical protein
MSPKAKEFRAKCAECIQRAKHIRDPEVRRALYDLAEQWLALAEYSEREFDPSPSEE